MALSELQNNLRRNIIRHLQLLSSAEDQLEYQRNVPFVNITSELICGWFDDHYVPESSDFSSSFSAQELQAMSKFNQVFDDILTSSAKPRETPEIEEFIKTSEWTRLSQAASFALRAFELERGK